MEFTQDFAGRAPALAALFEATFTASEGAGEGALIGELAARLMSETPPQDLRVFVALDDGVPIAAVVFTPLVYADDPRRVVLLSPMAVTTDRQGQGIGQALITHALSVLRADRVDVAITYGDPAFYGKVGFVPLSPDVAAPPVALSQPHGWIGQSLTGPDLAPLRGPSTCAPALDDPSLW